MYQLSIVAVLLVFIKVYCENMTQAQFDKGKCSLAQVGAVLPTKLRLLENSLNGTVPVPYIFVRDGRVTFRTDHFGNIGRVNAETANYCDYFLQRNASYYDQKITYDINFYPLEPGCLDPNLSAKVVSFMLMQGHHSIGTCTWYFEWYPYTSKVYILLGVKFGDVEFGKPRVSTRREFRIDAPKVLHQQIRLQLDFYSFGNNSVLITSHNTGEVTELEAACVFTPYCRVKASPVDRYAYGLFVQGSDDCSGITVTLDPSFRIYYPPPEDVIQPSMGIPRVWNVSHIPERLVPASGSVCAILQIPVVIGCVVAAQLRLRTWP